MGKFINTLTLDNLNIQKIELLKIKLSRKLSSNQNYLLSKTCKKSHSITQTLTALNKFVFHPNNCLFSLDLSYRESAVAAPAHFFSLAS